MRSEDVYCFSYTSGTTGAPKGAMITHGNVCAAICSSMYNTKVNKNDVYLSYLPMAHVLERMFFNIMIYSHVRVGMFSGDTRKLMDDL